MDRDNLERRIREIESQLIEIKTSQKMNSSRFKLYTYSASIPASDPNNIQHATVRFIPENPNIEYIVSSFDSTQATFGLIGENTLVEQNVWSLMRRPDYSYLLVVVSTTPGQVIVSL